MSTSLASLQPNSQSLERQKHVRTTTERLYNSLTKKRKDPKQSVQRMWINYEDCKDDFWAAIRSNYDYIMDTNLIDTCKEANGELTWDETDVSTQSWNLKEVSSQFLELYSWLRILQELVYSKEENLLDKSLRAAHMEELQRKAYRRKLFNEQAEKLVSRAPALKDEVAWRVDHLNAKWELVEQIMAPIDRPVSSQQDISADFEREVKCLRKWLRGMESRLQPLNFHVNWTLAELEEKAIEHMVLQRDIKAHGRIVSSVVKLGDKVFTQQQEQKQQQKQQHHFSQPLQIARSLERRWHQLFLLALEWQYHIEILVSRVRNKNAAPCSSDSDEEPVTKQPRLSRGRSRGSGAESPGQSARSTRTERTRRVTGHSSGSEYHHSVSGGTRIDPSDSDASSENRSVGEGSYFEDELCQLCVMDARSDEPAKREATSSIASTGGDRGEEGDIEDNGLSINDMPPTPDTVPITTSTAAMQETCDEIDAADTVQIESTEKSNNGLRTKTELKRCGATEVAASFNTSDRKSKNCATFYFKHLDTDSEADCSQPIQELSNTVDDSSEEEWTYTPARRNNSFVVSEQRRTNVVVRLDFDESPRVAVSEKMHFTQAKNADNKREMSAECMHDHDAQQKDSDDERKNDKSSIQRLIKEVENLIGEERHTASRSFSQLAFEEKNITNNHRAKYARVKEWLKLNASRSYEGRSQPLDSCDASGEYTTEESDGERQSISSDDLQSSVATYRRFEGALGCISQSPSQEILYNFQKTPINEVSPDESTPKVIMRSKQKVKGSRPWSVSCISQIGNNPNLAQINDPILPFSISETALHQLVTTPPTKSVSLDATGTRKSFNSTSTLLEESLICPDDRVVRNISFRRKKNRLRKKTLGRKSESSSESVHANHHSAGSDGSSNQQRSSRKMIPSRTMHTVPKDSCHSRSTTLVKSGSFSGCTVYQQLHAETALSNNSTPLRLLCCKSIASTSEIEGEDHNCAQGHLAYDNNMLNNAANSKELTSQQLNVDSDVEMNSLGNNSLYEQAWDNYQEKYMSEAYSEPLDVEMARRLLDFGDDYRNFLDSQSECASSISAIPASSPLPKIRTHHVIGDSTEESDSDEEDLRKIVENSQSQLILAENAFIRSNGPIPAELAEVESACKENLGCLKNVLDSLNGYLPNEKYSKQVRGMIERWETLSSRVEQAQTAGTLQRALTTMRTRFKAIHDRLFDYEIVLEPHLLDDRIKRIAADIKVLDDHNTPMRALNVSAHRLITDLGASAPLICIALKDSVADLYRIHDETSQKCKQQLRALQDVQQFGTCLAELQTVLQNDKESLAVLDVALQAGATPRIASSVIHFARLLSERQDVNCQGDPMVNDATTEEVHCAVKFAATSANSLTQEGGSLSDSGISDGSGSEQELSEREHRLANLRRISRSLEAQLAPGSKALVEFKKRIEDAESELRDLQRQCRELIVRTAAATSMDARAIKRTAANQMHYPVDKRKKSDDVDIFKSDAESAPIAISKSGVAKGDNPDSEPIPRGWIWRILKCSQCCCFVLVCLQVVLVCVEYFLKPNCCETTLSTQLFPMWSRDPKGPPPV
ncbi:uncharacterized protein LOC114928735 isoform X2 [Nylanderia fulva]|nr:uncharacterized protein LOC114928735 isoform X2 [Nylanderia fulva]XP_029155900.1 uncharacterized protein LOC114928735 isoform X2 [Nylanderia fulva]